MSAPEPRRSLPAAVQVPVAAKISSTGETYYTELVMVDETTGAAWRLVIRGNPPFLVSQAVPSWRDNALTFSSWNDMGTRALTWQTTGSWGF